MVEVQKDYVIKKIAIIAQKDLFNLLKNQYTGQKIMKKHPKKFLNLQVINFYLTSTFVIIHLI